MLAGLLDLRNDSKEQKKERLRKAALFAKYGIASSLAAPYDLGLTVGNLSKQGYNYYKTSEFGQPIAPYGAFSKSVRNALNNVPGLNVEPETYGERLLTAGADVLGSGLSAPIKAAGAFLPKTARFLTANSPREAAQFFGAGLGAQAATEAFPDSTLAPFVGGIAGSGAVNLPQNIGQGIKKGLKVDPQKVRTFQEAGLPYALGDVSDSNVVKTLQNIQNYSPFSAQRFKKNLDQTLERVGQLNKEIDKDISGTNLQNAITKYSDRSKDISTALKKRVDAALPPESFVEVPTLTSYLETNLVPKETISTRKIQESSPAFKYMKELQFAKEQNGGLLKAEDLETFWKQIGDDIGGAVRGGRREEARSLSELQKALKNDYKNAFKGNPQAQRTFERYTNFYADYAKKRDNIFDDLTKKVERRENRNIDPTGEGEKLLREYERSPIESFDKVKRLLIKRPDDVKVVYNTFKPSDRRVFNDAVIESLGINNAGTFTGERLARNFKQLPKKAQDLVVSNLPEGESKKFFALMDAMENIKSVKELSNTSKTAYYNNYYSLGKRTAGGLGAIGSAVAAGKVLGAATGAGTLLGAYLASYGTGRLFTSPKFINWAAAAIKQETPQGIDRYFKMLPAIAKNNPELAPDIEQLVQGLDGSTPSQRQWEMRDGVSEQEKAAADAAIKLLEKRRTK